MPNAPLIKYEDALAFLQKAQSTEGTSVYEHLTKVLAKVGPGGKLDFPRSL